jgi:predicted ATPase
MMVGMSGRIPSSDIRILEPMSTNALDYITIRGFKSIASIEELPLKPINVVIGPNGSGKSNFVGVFEFLREIRAGRLRDYIKVAGGADKILHFGSKTTREISFTLSFAGAPYELKLRPTAADELYEYEETTPLEGNPDRLFTYRPVATDKEGAEWDEERKRRLDRLLNWRIYHFDDTSFSSPMRKTASVDDNRFLSPDGANLPAFLYFLREKHQTSYNLVVRTVQRVAPFFEDFRLDPLRLNPDDIKLEWRHKKSDQYFDASSLSDGTLRFIALATLFLQPEQYRPSVILVDEPELGLHPYAIEMLAALVRQASATTQVVLSTQSSLLLDHFQPEDVLVADRVDGGTQLTRLESPDLAKWLEDYSLGQLWEKNEIGGRPVPG